MIKRVLSWIGNIVLVVLIALVVLNFYSVIQVRKNPGKIPSILGYTPLTVLTGSMRPSIQPGDMILTKEIDTTEIKEGDVVTYRKQQNMLVTHRVIEKINKDGKTMLKMKGDANNVEDDKLISSNQVVGTLAFKIPYGGYVQKFMISPIGIIVLFIVPILIIMASELKNVLNKRNKNINSKDSM
ncbi:signal peptidase I [Clostridium aestuarii]|uniref:Signal peptidase I n=1 Tax=Clostridium aestuarii TaxID=338193 RepID=A0ABT4CZI7_9CLOT|nr:signal peptidase I [Clostridium aestuarii]MCY6483355.1 signal peptidase I [Clostridium aestuarii]